MTLTELTQQLEENHVQVSAAQRMKALADLYSLVSTDLPAAGGVAQTKFAAPDGRVEPVPITEAYKQALLQKLNHNRSALLILGTGNTEITLDNPLPTQAEMLIFEASITAQYFEQLKLMGTTSDSSYVVALAERMVKQVTDADKKVEHLRAQHTAKEAELTQIIKALQEDVEKATNAVEKINIKLEVLKEYNDFCNSLVSAGKKGRKTINRTHSVKINSYQNTAQKEYALKIYNSKLTDKQRSAEISEVTKQKTQADTTLAEKQTILKTKQIDHDGRVDGELRTIDAQILPLQNNHGQLTKIAEAIEKIKDLRTEVAKAKGEFDTEVAPLLEAVKTKKAALVAETPTVAAAIMELDTATKALKEKYDDKMKAYTDAQKDLKNAIDEYHKMPEAAVTITTPEPEKAARTIVERGTNPVTGYTHDVIAGIQYSNALTYASSTSRTSISSAHIELFGDTLTGGRMARTYKDYTVVPAAGASPQPVKAIALRDESGTVTDHSMGLSAEHKRSHAIEMATLYARNYSGGPIIIAGGNDKEMAKMIHAVLECLLIGRKVEIKNYVLNGSFKRPFFDRALHDAVKDMVGEEPLNAAIRAIQSSPKLVHPLGPLAKDQLQKMKDQGQVAGAHVGENLTPKPPGM